MPKLEPIKGYVILEPEKEEETTASGIILVKDESKKPEIGTVLAVGKEAPENLKVGQKVFFNRHVPYRMEIEGKKFLVIDGREILAIIED